MATAGLVGDKTFAVRLGGMYAVLSSAVYNGGKGFTECIFNHTVDKDYRGKNPGQDLQSVAESHNFPKGSVGLMTAVEVKDTCAVKLEAGKTAVAAYVTVGYSNAWSAGMTTEESQQGVPGTINIMVVIDGHLTDPAMVNAVITATEAKARALAEAGLKMPGGELVTGTTTDAVVIAASMQGDFHEYAGPNSKAGRLVAGAVYQAMQQGIERYQARL